MKPFLGFLRTTMVGGVFFLLPLALTVWLLGRALKTAGRFLRPISEALPIHEVVGIAVADIIAALVLVAACFLAGLFARTAPGRSLTSGLERMVLKRVPGYTLLRSMAGNDGTLGAGGRVETALARLEDAWVLAFIVERHANGLLTVFVPSAPTPAAGTIYYLTEDRVRPLDMPVQRVAKLIMMLGVGSAEALRGKIDRPARGS